MRAGLFDCKPLQFLWAKFPEHYNENNTIMFDDLRRNYILNKQVGRRAALHAKALGFYVCMGSGEG